VAINSGTVSRPPLHVISLIVVVEQTHVTALLFDRMRTGHDSAGVVGVTPIVARQTRIVENNAWTSDVHKRRCVRPISFIIISTSLLKQRATYVRYFTGGQIELSLKRTSAAMSPTYFTLCDTRGTSLITRSLRIEEQRNVNDSVMSTGFVAAGSQNNAGRNRSHWFLKIFIISQNVARSFFVPKLLYGD